MDTEQVSYLCPVLQEVGQPKGGEALPQNQSSLKASVPSCS